MSNLGWIGVVLGVGLCFTTVAPDRVQAQGGVTIGPGGVTVDPGRERTPDVERRRDRWEERRGERRNELRDRMFDLRRACEDGDRRACVRFGIIIGENRERRAQWRRESPDLFWWER